MVRWQRHLWPWSRWWLPCLFANWTYSRAHNFQKCRSLWEGWIRASEKDSLRWPLFRKEILHHLLLWEWFKTKTALLSCLSRHECDWFLLDKNEQNRYRSYRWWGIEFYLILSQKDAGKTPRCCFSCYLSNYRPQAGFDQVANHKQYHYWFRLLLNWSVWEPICWHGHNCADQEWRYPQWYWGDWGSLKPVCKPKKTQNGQPL